jgi:predicted ribonuclease YlaK
VLLKFYDTNSLLNLLDKAFNESFICSSKTLQEIEQIKVSDKKDQDVKYRARQLAHLLDLNLNKYEVVIPSNETFEIIKEFQLEQTPDNIIMACAYEYNKNCKPVVFITDDICCKIVAKNVFGLDVSSLNTNIKSEYKGFIEKVMPEEEMAYFYGHLKENTYDLLINEYLIIRNSDGEEIDCYKWDGETHSPLYKKQVKSMAFGDKLKPKDIYQSMVIDSLMKNTITAISGKAGSGKSLLSLMVAMHLIETNKYDRLVVMFNPTKTRGASDLGFYSGSFIEKAMQNSIGQILTTKFGDRYAIDVLLQQEKLKLVSMSDARGIEIRDNEILYITECQNTSVELLKLCLSRASSGCKIIVEGDYNSQVDSYLFDGSKNGMKRAIEVLKGEDIFGYVELQHVWRSKIATLVDQF